MRAPPSPESQHIFAPGTFADQVAVVTGGGSGIGLATATELLRLGARVAICGRDQAKLDRASASLAEVAGAERVLAMPCDIRQPVEIDRFVAATLERFAAIDILVNNAGGQFPSPAQHIPPKGFEAVVRNNLGGTFNMTVAVANAAMIPRGNGRVVNVTAQVLRGFPGMVHTGAARAGVENMTMTLAVEWAHFGITVNAVAPGVIRSSGTERYPQEFIQLAERRTPLKRSGTVHEVAAAILFMCSPAAQFISGATLRVDGAQSLWGDVFEIADPA